MKNVLIKSSFFFIFFSICCKKQEQNPIKKIIVNKIDDIIQTSDTLIIFNDTITLTKNHKSNCILKISSNALNYVLPVTSCIDENNGWNWNIAFSNIKNETEELSKSKKKYINIDYDFILYQSRYDEFFFKINKNELFLVAYKYSIINKEPIVKIKNGKHLQIGEKEIINEKLKLFNVLVKSGFSSDFICEYRNNHIKYPFKIIKIMNYEKD